MHSSFMSYMCSLSGVKEDTVCSMIVLSGKRSSVGVAWMFNASSFAGSGDGSLRAWSTETGIEVACWTNNMGVPLCVKWAPRRLMFASASVALALWIPDLSKLPKQEIAAN
jgi:WD40 repeat protein